MLLRIVNNVTDMAKKMIVALLFVVCACSLLCAQTTYMGVTLDRGKGTETNCIYIFNDNADSVKIFIQYKIGNRHTEWIDYPVPQLIPPSILEPQLIGCVDSTIIGLNLLDVKIIKGKYILVDDEDPNKHNQEGFLHKIKSWFSKE